ncbi:hypothetical protein WOLCODRAFT_158220 [Wolfiporia cocos MD-104 SS10]|uniref:Uncharacterized protein n=1 Tax=Wolfiporia cocos (strain MD-104) TaxID=742152 RepID=A0A2H3JCH6_WOLCO|nr:hypothetical protein WOLCODRAFT_158220 [Wolfiporia cocos MD-104 SS10]
MSVAIGRAALGEIQMLWTWQTAYLLEPMWRGLLALQLPSLPLASAPASEGRASAPRPLVSGDDAAPLIAPTAPFAWAAFWVPCGPPHNPGLLRPTHNHFTRHDLVWPHSTSSTQPPLPIAQGRVRAAACGNSRLATRLALVAGTQGVPLHSNPTLTLPIGKPPSQQVPWANAGVRIKEDRGGHGIGYHFLL